MSDEEKLASLGKTIEDHAHMVARQEWETEHRPILMQVLSNAGLDFRDDSPPVLELGGRGVPIEAIVKAIREEFLKVRVKDLVARASAAVVEQAFKKLEEK
jgi:hypothetical protein